MALINKLKAIGDAIRAKTGKTDELTLDQMATEIAGIEGGNSGGGGSGGGDGGVNIMGGTEIGIANGVKLTEFTQLGNIICPNADIVKELAFDGCSGLVSIDLPIATYIDATAFAGCVNLTNINAPNVVDLDLYAFKNCVSLGKVNFPSVEYIRGNAFRGCTSLTTVDLSNLITIGASSFANCTNLRTVIFRSLDTVAYMELNSFINTPLMEGEGHFYVPSSMYDSYRAGYEAALDQLMPGFFDILFRKIEDYPEICG